jgi:transcriptional regulator NrdR family protein
MPFCVRSRRWCGKTTKRIETIEKTDAMEFLDWGKTGEKRNFEVLKFSLN